MTTKTIALVAGLIAAAFLVMTPASSGAEEDARPCPRGVVCLPPEHVTVEPPRPSTVYVIQRNRMSYQQSQTNESFTPDVVESVHQSPF